MSLSYWDIVLPTYIENWPQALYALSIAQIDIPLTIDDARRLGSNIIEYGEAFAPPQPIDDIRQKVTAHVAKFPNGAFTRLGSRSPKDSYLGYNQGFKVEANTDPLRFMLDASERIYEDLLLAIQHSYAPHIFIRQWMDIPRWAEFRCFMHDRKLVGISQYNYLKGEVFPEIIADPAYIQWAIENFFPDFCNASHLDSVVFDVFLKISNHANTRVTEVKLLEINPYFEMTDPCLFAWNKPEFRYNH